MAIDYSGMQAYIVDGIHITVSPSVDVVCDGSCSYTHCDSIDQSRSSSTALYSAAISALPEPEVHTESILLHCGQFAN